MKALYEIVVRLAYAKGVSVLALTDMIHCLILMKQELQAPNWDIKNKIKKC